MTLENNYYSICIHIFIFHFQRYGDWYTRLQRTFEIWQGMGMSLQGVRSCGDYMFSGHTSVITMLTFFITECRSRSLSLSVSLSLPPSLSLSLLKSPIFSPGDKKKILCSFHILCTHEDQRLQHNDVL